MFRLTCIVIFASLAIGCVMDPGGDGPSQTTTAALGGVTVAVDRSSYGPGEAVTVTYTGLPGNVDDWIAIEPASGDSTYFAYVFTNGQVNGTATITPPFGGTFVARAHPNNTFTSLAESATFSVGTTATITTDQSTYPQGATITVTYAGLPGYDDDWIAIATSGSATTNYVGYVFTGGQTSGTATLTAPAPGTYVARAFPRNTYSLVVESAPFITGAALTLATDRAAYGVGATISVTYGGLPGNSDDRIAIAQAGAANTSYVASFVTNGQTSGTATFTAPAAGTYVARVLLHNTSLLAQSATFTTSALSLVTDKSSYAAGEAVTITYTGMPGNVDDWISIEPAVGGDVRSFFAYAFTNGQVSGTVTITPPFGGTLVARAHPHNTYVRLGTSATFTVGSTVTITTDRSSYQVGDSITITYAGLPGYSNDWIAIALAGSASTSYAGYVFTGGATSGTAILTAPAAGTFVARAFPRNTFTMLAETATFTIAGP